MSPTEQNKIKVAIVGCGSIGRTHAAVVLEQPELELTALVDPIPEARAALVEWLAGQAAPAEFGSIGEALAAADLFVLARQAACTSRAHLRCSPQVSMW